MSGMRVSAAAGDNDFQVARFESRDLRRPLPGHGRVATYRQQALRDPKRTSSFAKPGSDTRERQADRVTSAVEAQRPYLAGNLAGFSLDE